MSLPNRSLRWLAKAQPPATVASSRKPWLAMGLAAVLGGLAPLPIAAVKARAAEAEPRAAGAHEHDRGTLNVAVDGNRLTIELEASGDDLLGFEHEARNAEQKAALDSTENKLKAPLGLFAPPAAAGCKLIDAKVEMAGSEQDHAAQSAATDKPSAHKPSEHKHGDHDHGEHNHGAPTHGPHAQVHADYELTCADPHAITALDLPYFKAFPRAQTLTVNVVTTKGQSSFEASPSKPTVNLGGLM